MEIGSGIAAAGCGMAMAAVLIKWIAVGSQDRQCGMHGSLTTKIQGIEKWLEKIEQKLDRVIERTPADMPNLGIFKAPIKIY